MLYDGSECLELKVVGATHDARAYP
jgi:hypothetical protein